MAVASVEFIDPREPVAVSSILLHYLSLELNICGVLVGLMIKYYRNFCLLVLNYEAA